MLVALSCISWCDFEAGVALGKLVFFLSFKVLIVKNCRNRPASLQVLFHSKKKY